MEEVLAVAKPPIVKATLPKTMTLSTAEDKVKKLLEEMYNFSSFTCNSNQPEEIIKSIHAWLEIETPRLTTLMKEGLAILKQVKPAQNEHQCQEYWYVDQLIDAKLPACFYIACNLDHFFTTAFGYKTNDPAWDMFVNNKEAAENLYEADEATTYPWVWDSCLGLSDLGSVRIPESIDNIYTAEAPNLDYLLEHYADSIKWQPKLPQLMVVVRDRLAKFTAPVQKEEIETLAIKVWESSIPFLKLHLDKYEEIKAAIKAANHTYPRMVNTIVGEREVENSFNDSLETYILWCESRPYPLWRYLSFNVVNKVIDDSLTETCVWEQLTEMDNTIGHATHATTPITSLCYVDTSMEVPISTEFTEGANLEEHDEYARKMIKANLSRMSKTSPAKLGQIRARLELLLQAIKSGTGASIYTDNILDVSIVFDNGDSWGYNDIDFDGHIKVKCFASKVLNSLSRKDEDELESVLKTGNRFSYLFDKTEWVDVTECASFHDDGYDWEWFTRCYFKNDEAARAYVERIAEALKPKIGLLRLVHDTANGGCSYWLGEILEKAGFHMSTTTVDGKVINNK